jgi:outer membrane autotransporter protein
LLNGIDLIYRNENYNISGCENESELDTIDYSTILAQSKRGTGGCLWSNLYYSDTKLKPKNSPTKIKPEDYGIQIGLDVLTDHEVYSTFTFNVNEAKIKFGNQFKSTNDNFLFGYGKIYHWQVAHVGLGASVGYDQYRISSTGQNFDGQGLQSRLDGEFGLSFIFKRWEIKPFYAMQYNFVYHGKIDSAANNVAFSDWNGHGLTQLIGLRLNWKPIENTLLLQSRITWIHELLNNPPPFYSSYFSSVKGKGATTPSIYFFDGNIGRDWVWIGLGLKWSFWHQRSLFIDYDIALNERQTTHLINLGLCFGW